MMMKFSTLLVFLCWCFLLHFFNDCCVASPSTPSSNANADHLTTNSPPTTVCKIQITYDIHSSGFVNSYSLIGFEPNSQNWIRIESSLKEQYLNFSPSTFTYSFGLQGWIQNEGGQSRTFAIQNQTEWTHSEEYRQMMNQLITRCFYWIPLPFDFENDSNSLGQRAMEIVQKFPISENMHFYRIQFGKFNSRSD